MERNFCHPWGMYHGNEAGPRFTGADMHCVNNWRGRPFPQWRQDPPDPQWHHPDPQWHNPNPQWRHPDPQWHNPDPQWHHPDSQWDHFHPWQGQNHQQSQCYPDRQQNQFHPEQTSRNYGFDNGNFPHRGRGSYRRHSQGRSYGKHSSSFFKGKDNSQNSSCVLVEIQQSVKKKDVEVKKDESRIPKETKQAQEASVASVKQAQKDSVASVKQAQEDSKASVKQSDPPQINQEASKTISPSQFRFCLASDSLTFPVCSPAEAENTELVSLKASKAIISPSQFSFRLPPDSLSSSVCSPEQSEDTDLIKLGTSFETDNSHQITCCTQAATSELPATLENLECKKEDVKIELDKSKGIQTTEVQPSQSASFPSPETPMEGQITSNTAGNFHPVIKEEPMWTTEAHCSLVASLVSFKASTRKQASLDTMKDSHPVVKKVLDTESHSCQAASFASDEAPIQATSKITESIHPMVKEEPVLVPEANQDMNIASLTDHSSVTVTEASAPSSVVKPPAPVETREALLSPGKEEDELGDSHKDTDCSQACNAVAGVSSDLPVITSDVHSVPVLVSGKVIEQPYFWESLHAQTFNWSNVGKGWAPEDYQEPSWGVDKAKNSGDVSEPDRNLVVPCSSFHSHHSSDRNPDTGRVLECHSSSPKSHHNSDSKHSSSQTTKKNPLRQGHHSRSPLRKRRHSRFPVRRDRSHSRDSKESSGEREIIRTDCCSKCCQNSSQERFQERELPRSYSVHKMNHYHSSKETRKSHAFSTENSTKSRKKKLTHHEETKKKRSTSVKETKSSKPRKKKSLHHEETKKGRSTSVKETNSSKVTIKGGEVLNPIIHDAALAVETSIPAKTSEHSQSENIEVFELVQLAPSSEDIVFPHQPCAQKETGISSPSKVVEDPRSVAVLTKRNQIEEDYLQVMLNFAVVATMLLQKEPCMEQTLEVALRANMRRVGDYYESMLKNFIENYDLSETH